MVIAEFHIEALILITVNFTAGMFPEKRGSYLRFTLNKTIFLFWSYFT